MNTHQVAGRHGSFMTQFVRPARSRFATREAMLRANSRKAVNRRLVLPLDSHHWSRAFEVLSSRYARLGRTPEHYQTVIRDMVSHGTSTQERAGIAEALDRLREQAFAEEIPVNRSLWCSLVYAYCALEKPDEALEAFAQAQRRFPYSAATLQYMAELVLPVAARAGQYDVACQLYATYFPKDGKHSKKDEEAIHQWLAEAAARSGVAPDKVTAHLTDRAGPLSSSPLPSSKSQGEPQSTVGTPRTVHALFVETDKPAGTTALNAKDMASSHTSHTEASSDALMRLSTPALRRLLHTSCTNAAEQTQELSCALRCWSLLFGPWVPADAAMPPSRLSAPSATDVQLMLNALAVCGRADDALDLFTHVFLGCGAQPFLPGGEGSGAAPMDDTATAQPSTTPFDLPEDAQGPLRYGPMPLDATTLDLVFSTFVSREVCVAVPKRPAAAPAPAAGEAHAVSLTLTQLQNPLGVVRLFDVVLWKCEDAHLTDRMAAVVCSALIQLGQLDRATSLLQRCPAFDVRPGKKVDMRVPSDPAQRAVREKLCSMVYYLHACTTLERRVQTLQDFAFLFPPEVFRHLPPPQELQQRLREAREKTRTSADLGRPYSVHHDMDDEARLSAALAQKMPTSLRPSRHHYFPSRSSAALTTAQESAMQRDFARLQARKDDAFHGSLADAEKDPRPIPKGLHDHASGWEFFGRGGEMVFSNHRRTPHLLSMRPKVMRALADPYRSWNPKLNSSLAHKENVRKWNGKSAV